MSALEGSLGSSDSSAAPPPSAPAAAPPAAAPPPAAAASVAPTAAPAVAGPDVPAVNDAVASTTPGAPPSEPATPKSLDEVKQRYHQRLDKIAAEQEGAQPATTPAEAQPAPEIAEPTQPEKIEAAPEEAAPVAPIEAAPAEEPVAEIAGDDDYREHAFTAEELEARFARKLSKKEAAEIAKWEAHRGELLTQRNAIGGDVGVKIASVINPILLDTDNPTEADVDTIFDQILLPENAGAEKLFDLMGKRLVNTQLQEADCGQCLKDGNRPNPECADHLPMGKEFAGNMISEEWGKTSDGKAFDFRGMKPLELVDLLMRAAMAVDDEGQPLVNVEFLKGELEGNAPAKPSERELALQQENEELRTRTKNVEDAKAAEAKAKDEAAKVQYRTQARGFVTQHLMKAVTPLAIKANWAPTDGEDGPAVQEKKELGELIADHVSMKLMGPAGAPSADYQALLDMIEDNTAFLPTGQPTTKFIRKLEPLQAKAKALFNRKLATLNPRLKFASANGRNAQLVKKNGIKTGAPNADAPPPLAVVPPPQADRPKTTEELLAEKRAKYREARARVAATPGVL